MCNFMSWPGLCESDYIKRMITLSGAYCTSKNFNFSAFKIILIPACSCGDAPTKSSNPGQFQYVGHIHFMDKTGLTIGSCIATAVTKTHILTSTACLKDNNGQNNTKKFTFYKANESIFLLQSSYMIMN